MKRNRCPQDMPWATKEGQGHQSPPLEKPLKEFSTLPQARGLLLGTNTRVPEEEELMTINIDSSEQSRARLQLQPTLGAQAPLLSTSGSAFRLARPLGLRSASPDPWVRAPPRSTFEGWFHLARPLGPCSNSPDPWVWAPPRPSLGIALRLSRPLGRNSASPDPEDGGSVSSDGDPYRRQPLQVQAYGSGSKL